MGFLRISVVGSGNPGPSWHVIGTGDYNLDQKSDIPRQNDDGTPATWNMFGTNVISMGIAGSFNLGTSSADCDDCPSSCLLPGH